MRRAWAAAAVIAAAGCACKTPPATPPYTGPTDDLATLVDKLNARNGRLTSLWADGSFSADFIDPTTHRHDGGDGDAVLLVRPPRDLRLVGKVFGQRVFDVASNDERFWVVLPKQDRMVWGTHAAAGRDASLPIRPDVIAEVLGVTPLNTDLLAPPAPLLRFDAERDCYDVIWHVRLRDRWAVEKEVWYDRATLLPTRVLLYDANGRVVMRAAPSEARAVAGYEPPLVMPSRYDLSFPDTGSTFTLRLRALERQHNGVPGERSFVFPADPGVSKVEPLDR